MEKLVVIGATATFSSSPDPGDTNIKTVKKDEEYLITQVEKLNGEYWIKAKIDESFEGYIKEGNNIAVILPVKLYQKEVVVYQQPASDSNKISILKKKSVFNLIHKTFGSDNKNKIWDKVKLQTGEYGYINSDTKIVPVNQAEIKRKKYCAYAVFILYALGLIRLIIMAALDGLAFDSEVILELLGFVAYGLFGIIIWYFIFVAISGLFKSKTEKIYYPNLFAIYNNQII